MKARNIPTAAERKGYALERLKDCLKREAAVTRHKLIQYVEGKEKGDSPYLWKPMRLLNFFSKMIKSFTEVLKAEPTEREG